MICEMYVSNLMKFDRAARMYSLYVLTTVGNRRVAIRVSNLNDVFMKFKKSS